MYPGADDTGACICRSELYASLAQLEERRTVNPCVVGSIPARSATRLVRLQLNSRGPVRRGRGSIPRGVVSDRMATTDLTLEDKTCVHGKGHIKLPKIPKYADVAQSADASDLRSVSLGVRVPSSAPYASVAQWQCSGFVLRRCLFDSSRKLQFYVDTRRWKDLEILMM